VGIRGCIKIAGNRGCYVWPIQQTGIFMYIVTQQRNPCRDQPAVSVCVFALISRSHDGKSAAHAFDRGPCGKKRRSLVPLIPAPNIWQGITLYVIKILLLNKEAYKWCPISRKQAACFLILRLASPLCVNTVYKEWLK